MSQLNGRVAIVTGGVQGIVDTLVWLVNQLSGRGIGLSAGQVTTLGAAIAGVPMGRSVTAEVGDWGRIEATVADA